MDTWRMHIQVLPVAVALPTLNPTHMSFPSVSPTTPAPSLPLLIHVHGI